MESSKKIQKGQSAKVTVCFRMGEPITRTGIVSKVGGTWFRVLVDGTEYTFNRKTFVGTGKGLTYCEFPTDPS